MAESVILEKFSKFKPKKKFKGIELGQVLLDYTPASHFEEIETRRAKKTWLTANVVILAGCVFTTLGIFSTTLITQNEVQSSRIEKIQMQAQLGQYSQEDNAVNQNSDVVAKLTQAAGGEVNWRKLVDDVQNALPGGTNIASISINADAESSERGAVVLLGVTSDSPVGYADTINAMENMAGITNLNIGQLSGGGSYAYSMTFDFDTDVRTYRFSNPVESADATNEEAGE